MTKVWLAVLLAMASAFSASAQEEKKDNSESFVNSYGVFGGRMLPENIDGVASIYPYWGVRYSHSMWGVFPEFSASFINSQNLNFYTGSLSFAFPDKVAGFIYIPFVGVDFHEYTITQPSGSSQTGQAAGLHFGVSPVIDITSRVAIRTDLKFDFGPGWELYVGSGLMVGF